MLYTLWPLTSDFDGMWIDAKAVCLLPLGTLRKRRMTGSGKVAWTEYQAPFTLTDTLWLLLSQRVGHDI